MCSFCPSVYLFVWPSFCFLSNIATYAHTRLTFLSFRFTCLGEDSLLNTEGYDKKIKYPTRIRTRMLALRQPLFASWLRTRNIAKFYNYLHTKRGFKDEQVDSAIFLNPRLMFLTVSYDNAIQWTSLLVLFLDVLTRVIAIVIKGAIAIVT